MKYLTEFKKTKKNNSAKKQKLKISLFEESTDFLRAYFYPDRCVLCGEVIKYKTCLCPQCEKSAPIIKGERCLDCGCAKSDCSCAGKANFFKGITSVYKYEGVVKKGIKEWKYRGADYNTDYFASEIASCAKKSFSEVEFDCVTYVPQTEEEADERRYNQGEMLAEAVAKKLTLPEKQLLIKIFATERQHNISLHLKSGNIFGVFECIEEDFIKGKNILIIDDVKTSGRTLNECAKMLELYGAESVYCAVIAVTASPEKRKQSEEKK